MLSKTRAVKDAIIGFRRRFRAERGFGIDDDGRIDVHYILDGDRVLVGVPWSTKAHRDLAAGATRRRKRRC